MSMFGAQPAPTDTDEHSPYVGPAGMGGELADGAVTTPKIADDAVTPAKVSDKTLYLAREGGKVTGAVQLGDNGFYLFPAIPGAATWSGISDINGFSPRIIMHDNNNQISVDAFDGQLRDHVATTRVRWDATGLGFFGKTPVARPTGVPVTAAGVHAALVSLGLITA